MTATTLTEGSDPGTYEVVTSTGSIYTVVLDPDRLTKIARVRDRKLGVELYGADEEADQSGDFDELGAETFLTFRQTTEVVEIRKA